MNTASLTLMNILQFLKCFLFIIPLIISFNIEKGWKKNKIIGLKSWNNTSNETSEKIIVYLQRNSFLV